MIDPNDPTTSPLTLFRLALMGAVSAVSVLAIVLKLVGAL